MGRGRCGAISLNFQLDDAHFGCAFRITGRTVTDPPPVRGERAASDQALIAAGGLAPAVG
jgi:hypothetical protein